MKTKKERDTVIVIILLMNLNNKTWKTSVYTDTKYEISYILVLKSTMGQPKRCLCMNERLNELINYALMYIITRFGYTTK